MATPIRKLLSPLRNVYIHFPFCRRKCHFCAFPVHAIGSNPIPSQSLTLFSTYLSHLTTQISSFTHPFTLPLQTLYLGGGTPSLLPFSMVKQVIDKFRVDSNTQVTIEMMPTEAKDIERWMEIGVNRFSVGVQTTNQGLLEGVNRGGYHQGQLLQVLKQLKEVNLNIDMMIGMNQTEQDRKQMLNFISQVSPRQVTIYMLQLNEGSYLHRQGHTHGSTLPTPQQTSLVYLQTCKAMSEMGYTHYQVSTFHKQNSAPSKHNLVYWQGNRDFAAFGMGATSLINGVRETRPRRLADYYRYVNREKAMESVTDETVRYERLAARLMSRLRTVKGVDYGELHREFGQEVAGRIRGKVNQLARQNQELFNCGVLEEKIELTTTRGFLCCDLIVYQLLDEVQGLLKQSEALW